VTSTLRAARIGNAFEVSGQGGHMVDGEHDLG
jgi:hypothetical protein